MRVICQKSLYEEDVCHVIDFLLPVAACGATVKQEKAPYGFMSPH